MEVVFFAAQIVGIDIDPTCADLAQERVRIEIDSQADAGFLRAVCGASPPTIFINDGSHLAGHIVFTLETLFPLLEPGGVYVIEDLAFHGNTFPGQWQTEIKVNISDYFARLMLPLMPREEPTDEPPAALLADIDSIDIVRGALLIRKKQPLFDMQGAAAAARTYLGAARKSRVLDRLANHLVLHEAPVSDVLGAVEAAISADGASTGRLCWRAMARARSGASAPALEDARAALRRADAKDVGVYAALSECLESLGDERGALEAAEAGLALRPQHAGLQRVRDRLRARAEAAV